MLETLAAAPPDLSTSAPGPRLLDRLEDELIHQVVGCIPPDYTNVHNYPAGWPGLSTCSRRLCTLVRSCRRAVKGDPQHVLSMASVPRQRAFSGTATLTLQLEPRRAAREEPVYVPAVAAAVEAWPQLEEVELGREVVPLANLCGAMAALQHAAALRRLALTVREPSSLIHLAALTQLTRLELLGARASTRRLEWVDDEGYLTCPLAALAHLVSLQLERVSLPALLPPNLTRLELENVEISDERMWGRVAACQQLLELDVLVEHAVEVPSHPTLVLQALAGHLPQLRMLRVAHDGLGQECNAPECLKDMMDTMLRHAGIPKKEAGKKSTWWPRPPLGQQQGYDTPEAYVAVPPPNMGGLPALQHLFMRGHWLVVSTDRYWRHLAGCSNLKKLSALHATVPPPAGVTFPGVTELHVTTSTSPGDTLDLLAAFPALQLLWLRVVPSRAAAAKGRVGHQAPLPCVTQATIILELPDSKVPPAAAAACLAAYCSTLWGALPGLQQLELGWSCSVALLPLLPAVSTLQQLRELQLGAWVGNKLWTTPPVVGVGEVLQVVQGAVQLRKVAIEVELAAGSSRDQLVLGLQEVLPALVWLRVPSAACDGSRWGLNPPTLQPATLAALRPGLKLTRT